MATFIGIGYSANPEPQEAAFQAALMARKQLNQDKCHAVIVYATPSWCQSAICAAIQSVLNTPHLVGSSCNFIILSQGVFDQGIAVLAIYSEDLFFSSHCVSLNQKISFQQLGFDFCRKLNHDISPHIRQGCLIYSDILTHDSDALIRGMQEVLGLEFPLNSVISSTASHAKSYQFFADNMETNSISALMIAGKSPLLYKAGFSYKPLGQPRTVTLTREHVLRTIDHQPASNIYTHFLNQDLNAIKHDPLKPYQLYPLGFYVEKKNSFLIRTPVDFLADGSIVCQGEIPPDSEVHIMISNKDLCLQTASQVASAMAEELNDTTVETFFLFESTNRHRILGRSHYQAIDTMRNILGYSTPIFGMGTFGEICNFHQQPHNILYHNGSLVLSALI